MGSRNGLGNICAKIILIITNVLFFLIGLAFFAMGMFLKFGSKFIQTYVDKLMASADKGSIQIKVDEWTGSLAVGFIVTGIAIMSVGVFGMCGACCSSKILLLTYALVIFIVVAFQVVGLIIFLSGVVDKAIKKKLHIMVDTKFGGVDSFEPESLLLNFAMVQFKCCGIDNWEDFNATGPQWTRVRVVNVTNDDGQSAQINITLITPFACCKMDADRKPIDSKCAVAPTPINNNMLTGCYDQVAQIVNKTYKWPAIGIVVLAIVLELILGVLALVIWKATKMARVGAF